MSEQSIFFAALDISDSAERSAYIIAACGSNEALRKEVEALIAAHERPGAFLDAPAVAQIADSGAGETRTVAPGADPNFAETRAPDTVSGEEVDVLAYLQPPTRSGSLGRLAHYEVQEVLGKGGFGTVLRAFDDRLHRVVAIKVMAPQLAASGAARARFLREGRSAAAVRDEHVVNVHAVSGDDEPIPYLVMEFVAGQTLQQKLDKTGPLSVAEVLRIGSQIARGLAAAHATGLIHRDIKPLNILLENGVERVKITDFGLARAADDASISQSGVVAGTPQYMAPEQARGEAIDHRADLFSLGSVLYAMCTGRPPFRAETTLAVLKRVCEDDPRPVREVNPQVPRWLADVVAKLHAKNPAERFQSAKEVADLLARYLTELQLTGTVSMPERVATAAEEWLRGEGRPRPVRVAIYCGVLLVISMTALVLWSRGQLDWVGVPGLMPTLGVSGILAVLFIVWFSWLQWKDYYKLGLHRKPGTPARAPRRRWKRVAAAIVLLLAVVACAYAGPFALRYANDEGKITYPDDPGDEKVLVRRDGRIVATIDPAHPVVHLPSGDYELEAVFGEGYEPSYYSAVTRRLFGEPRRAGSGGPVLKLTIQRGDSTRLVVSMRERAAPPSPGSGEEDFVPLFNGKDLTGWKMHPDAPGQWRVENGQIIGSGPTSHLFTESDRFRNFHLRVEAKVNKGGDSGVFVRVPFEFPYPRGLEAQISGQAEEPYLTGSLLRHQTSGCFPHAAVQKLHRPDEWFRMDIIVEGDRIRIKVNDQVTTDYRGFAGFTGGHVSLQTWSDPVRGTDTVAHFRKIEVKELTADAPPLAVAPFDAAKAKEHQDAWAKRLGVPVESENAVGMKLRLIPPGEYTMGSSKEEIDWLITKAPDLKDAEEFIKDWVRSEGAARRVTIREPFLLGAHEVTVGQFREFVKATGYKTDAEKAGGGFGWNEKAKKWERAADRVWNSPEESGGDNHPVKFLTSDDIRAFCDWLGRQDGRKYVIPTEEQWEYACRAGTTTRWSFGDDPSEMWKHAWTAPHASGKHHPVGRLGANPFGLFDMYGNVGELVLTAQGEEYQRGGTATESPQRARSASRVPVRSDLDPIWTRGFRVAVIGDLRAKNPLPAVTPFDAAKAKEHQEAWAKYLGVKVEYENSVGMKMRLIPPGEFTMGCTSAEFELFKAEDHGAELKRQMPNHTVKLTKPYRVGATEVTVGQFRRFVKDAKYKTEAEIDGTGGDVIAQGKHAWKAGIYWDKPGYEHTDECPVTQVSWNDAAEFCNWLSRKEELPPVYVKDTGGWRVVPGPGYRLPTEAEWEFACRAGSRTSYFFGDDPKQADDYAWHKGNADGHPHLVGGKLPNSFGLFDVLGNVREWVADWDDEKHAPQSLVTDPQGPAAGTRRVMRGSGWSSTPSAGPSAFRSHTFPRLRLCYLGFRVARTADAAPPPKEADLAVLQPLRDAVAAKGRVVAEAKLRLEAGKAGKLDLLAAQVELREANIKLAEAEGDTAILILHHRELVKLREEERKLIAVRVKEGVDRQSLLDDADARLSDARARLAKLRPPEIAPPPRPKP